MPLRYDKEASLNDAPLSFWVQFLGMQEVMPEVETYVDAEQAPMMAAADVQIDIEPTMAEIQLS
jgi:hypothetical protein